MINLSALEAARGLPPTANNVSRIADLFGTEASAWAFSQWSLRQKAKRKFTGADEMLFTTIGLEQASHEAVAAYHASLFPVGELVADLTCGIGGDLIALTERGPAIGFETDHMTAAYAAFNAPDAKIVQEDCLRSHWEFVYAFADPSRRDGFRRTLDPSEFTPDPIELAARMQKLRFALMKLSPMLSDDFLQSLHAGIEFVSFGWECREALAWFGDVEPFDYRAVKVETLEKLSSGGNALTSDEPFTFIYEADPAAIRAHCLPNVCDALDAQLLGDSNGYLTGKSLEDSAWVKRYSVRAHGQFDLKRVRSILRSMGGGVPEIKSRAKVDAVELRRKLATEGDATPVVILYPVQKSVRFAIVDQIK